GYTSEEIEDMHVTEFVPEAHSEIIANQLETILETRQSVTVESAVVTKRGDHIPFEFTGSPLEDGNGNLRGVTGVGRNISKRKEREQQLQLERDRWLALFENLGEPVVETTFENDTAIIKSINTPFENTFQVTKEDVIGKSLNDIIVPEAEQDMAHELNRKVKEGMVAEREVQRQTATGLQWFSLRTVPYSIDDEKRAFAIYIDISDRKAHEQQLKRQNERLEKFASVVSHDLKSPLNVAEGYIDLAKAESDSEYLDAVSDALDRMEELIDDVLTLAREGQVVEEPEPVDIGQLVETSWKNVETGNATFRCKTEGTIRADQSRVQQLLENLIKNAIDHGGSNVTITIGDIDSNGFYIEDDGPGIPEEDPEQVLESGYSTTEKGTGFGLSIVQEIVAAHGWDLSITESKTGGARFEITGVEFVTT
ncbi:MAG: PAS domain-containing sensor histidine kinase, partial [Halobacteriaceae archaeon]